MQLDNIVAQAEKRNVFPSYLTDVDDAVLFFCAAFNGINDVVYYRNVKRVWLVDTDCEKLEGMKKIYTEKWVYVCEDAFDLAWTLYGNGKQFDVVSCDAWSSLAPRILTEEFEHFYKIARKYLVVYATENSFFKKHKIEKNLLDISNFLTYTHQQEIKVIDLLPDGDCDGGGFRIVIRRWDETNRRNERPYGAVLCG